MSVYDRFLEITQFIRKRSEEKELKRNFLNRLKEKAKEELEDSDTVILVGVTPFARKMSALRDRLFPGKDVILADRREDLPQNVGGGNVLFYVRGRMSVSI